MATKIDNNVPMPHRSRNLLKSLNVYLPWDTLKPGQSFFVPGASENDKQSIYVAASRRKIRIRTEFRNEAQGRGLRVWREE